MQQIMITSGDAGQRLDKFLRRYLPQASGSLLYKMLRKKNITLNARKADGSEILQAGDAVALFFAEETFARFRDTGNASAGGRNLAAAGRAAYRRYGALPVLYEDGHVLLVSKPAGILSQKASAGDLSLNEWLIGYLLSQGEISEKTLQTFRPSVCNRLDRNTSGIVICGKSLYGSQQMSRVLKERSMHKYYLLYVEGRMQEAGRAEGFLYKDRAANQVEILCEKQPGSEKIITAYRPVRTGRSETLVEVELITGKSHQIRAHMASMGFPIVGDSKYGSRVQSEQRRRQYGITHQLLHAWRVVFPQFSGELACLSGREFRAPLPQSFQKLGAGRVSDE